MRFCLSRFFERKRIGEGDERRKDGDVYRGKDVWCTWMGCSEFNESRQ